MLFTLKNLGRLEEATIDLGKDLIVLTGPNNTSKTYVAHAIYGLCTSLRSLLQEVVTGMQLTQLSPTSMPDHVEIDVVELFRSNSSSLLSNISRECTDRLATYFASSQQFTARAEIALAADDAERGLIEKRLSDLTLRHTSDDGQVLFEKSQGGTFTATVMPNLAGSDAPSKSTAYISGLINGYVAGTLTRALFDPIARAYIFAAERSAIEMFSRELAAKRFDPLGKREAPPAYPLALADGLIAAQQRASTKTGTSPYSLAADRLEREILEGTIEIGAYGEMLFLPTGTTQRLDMNLSSSSVKALASLSVYLRHLAQRGDFLIIDEPELNLHPRNQRLVARLLARLSRAGIKVMMSTHSDYIIRELNNLIMLNRDKDGKLREKHGYHEDEILDPENVGAYAFDGAHGRSIPVGPAGMKIEAMDRDTKELNRSSRDIYFELDDGEEEA